jgi:hypothetical protein
MYTAAKRIEALRKQGWKVNVRIQRPHSQYQELRSRFEVDSGEGFIARGGFTTVVLTPPDGKFCVGVARCHPLKDDFNKKIGLEIALGRALKQAEENHVHLP